MAIVFSSLKCTNHQKESDFEYFKVLTLTGTDSITAYNKGVTLGYYAHYDSKNDSLIYRASHYFDPPLVETFTGILSDKKYLDTIRTTIKVLRGYSDGIIPDPGPQGALYCGPQLIAEYKDENGIHTYAFILGSNEKLDQFVDFFSRLEEYPWKKNLVDNNVIQADSEAVAALSALDAYKDRRAPYVPLPCDSVIDYSKLFGSWRSVGNRYNLDSNTYWKLVISQNNDCYFERIRDGLPTKKTIAKYTLNKRDNTIIITTTEDRPRKYTIRKLSDVCFEYEIDPEELPIRYDRQNY